MTTLLTALNLAKSFPRHGGLVEVLRGCELTLDEGEAVAITGLSGSGKSTLLNILGGLDMPSEGRVAFRGEELDFRSHAALSRWRTEVVGFVFQFHFLLPDFTALENLLIPVRAQRTVGDRDRQRAMEFMERMGIADRSDHLPGELSGGEQQRVAVARAFMNNPRIVLADEPTGNLDSRIGGQLSDLLFDLKKSDGTSLIIVTHDSGLAARADRHLELDAGVLVPAVLPTGADS